MTLRARRPPPPKATGTLLVWTGVACVLVACGIVIYVAKRSHDPTPVERPVTDTAAAPKDVPPQGLRGPVDALLDDCESLVRQGNWKKALDAIDEFPARGLPESEKERLSTARSDLQKKAAEFVEGLAKEAEALARQGLLQEGADRLRATAGLALAAVVGEAYQRLRRAADDWLKARRAESKGGTERALAELSARYAAARPPDDPESAWKRAQRLVEEEKWAESIEPLTALAALPDFRERALLARAQAHHALGQAVGVLLDGQILLESGKSVGPAVEWIERAMTRAPMDETVHDLYERLIEKGSVQPRLWESLSTLWTWRHDIERAARTYERADAKGVRFDGAALERMRLFVQFRQRGLPHGNPVVVDYAGPYEILTDAGPARARELARQLEAIAKEYTAGFKHGVNPNLRFRVLFFSHDWDFKEYHKALNKVPAGNTIAFYSPSIHQLVVVDSPRQFEETVRHEAFHQFLHYFVDEPPRWFNEGSASFFQKSTFGRPVFDPDYHAGAHVALLTNRLPSLKDLMTMTPEAWVRDERKYLFYCQSWSFIYWLHRQGQAALLDEYERLLVLGHPSTTAFERVWAGKLAELEPRWRKAALSGHYPN